MSGGHFCDCGYTYYEVEQFADELEEEIQNNNKEDEFGYASNLSPETIQYLREKLRQMRKIAKIMRHIDYLYSGDHGEDSFMWRVKEEEKHWAEIEDLVTRMDGWDENF